VNNDDQDNVEEAERVALSTSAKHDSAAVQLLLLPLRMEQGSAPAWLPRRAVRS